jgi:hypothetical protein
MGKHLHDLEVTEYKDHLNNALAEAVEFYWGERCPDYEPLCPVCAAWKQYDKLITLAEANNVI